jgi:hypothetical protein
MFESSHPRSTYSTSSEFDPIPRRSPASRLLHEENDIILTNGFDHQAFHQPNTRKITKVIPSIYSIEKNKSNLINNFSLFK